MSRTALDAYFESLATGNHAVESGTKEKLLLELNNIKALLPEDLPPSALANLARHIRSGQSGDLRNIAMHDGPTLLEKVEQLVLAADDEHAAEFDIRNLVDEVFRRKLISTIDSEEQDYHALVLNCSVLLADRFKARTGMADEMGAIGKAFSLKEPTLLLPPDLDSETNRNWQQGAMLLFQGFRAFFRNTHAHGVTDTDRDTAFQALMLFSLLLNILMDAKLTAELTTR
ncbi:TIGR02391 family protein [Rhizorhabdus phycosphaerae]|uniref:TIGR02391 family protein n=1 Tax=Rhizorhabdus phycosphaerae TaxID=2711156 RepID=UPI0013ECE04A|nr:TIGR02391 family protein [Rhizorhabdus phycosphaerae]